MVQLCDGVLEALTDTLSYCSGCLCKWAAKVDASRRAGCLEPGIVSGPAFFHGFDDDHDYDVQPDLDVVPSMLQVEQVQVRAGARENIPRHAPVSRRTRRRYNRRLRLAALGQSDFLEPLIEPLCRAQGAPKTSQKEVTTGSWSFCQEMGGRWPWGLGGQELGDANQSAWTFSDVHCTSQFAPSLSPSFENGGLGNPGIPPGPFELGPFLEHFSVFPGQALDNAGEWPVKHSKQPDVRHAGGSWSDFQKQSICRPNPCHSSLHGDPNVLPDGCTRKIESPNSLCSPSLCLPSRKGSPNPNLAVFPAFAEKMARVACGFPEFSSFAGHFPGRETNPHFGAQNGTLSASPTYFPGQATDNAAEVPGKHHTPPDLCQAGGAGKDFQKELLNDLKQAVLAGDSAPLLDIVEKMEQRGVIVEGTFGWKAAELAVETQEDVPKHVACWALDDALANLVVPKQRADLQVITANITSWRKDLCQWISQQKASVFMLQETHLSPERPDLIEAQLGFHGYNVLSIPAHPTGKGGTSGGLAICFRKHLNLRRVHHFVRAGAGFQVAALRLKDVDCYLVNVYLKAGEGFQGSHNALILANLIAFLRSVRGLYFVAGDFNEDFEVIAASTLAQEAKGRWVSSGESTCAGGGNIDYGLLAPVLAAGAHLSLDWVTPFAPHAALHWSLQLQHFDVRLPQLVPFKPAPAQPQPFHLRLDINSGGEQAALFNHAGFCAPSWFGTGSAEFKCAFCQPQS